MLLVSKFHTEVYVSKSYQNVILLLYSVNREEQQNKALPDPFLSHIFDFRGTGLNVKINP